MSGALEPKYKDIRPTIVDSPNEALCHDYANLKFGCRL